MYIIILENVNGSPKGIGLGIIFVKKINGKMIN